MITSDREELANYLVKREIGESIWPLGIDGKDGAGKSALAKIISKPLDAKIISLDNFLERHQDNYLESLRLGELAKAIHEAGERVIIEGVCLLAAVERVGIKLGDLIYVKRTKNGIWLDEETCHFSEPPNKVIEEQKRGLSITMAWYANNEGKAAPSEEDLQLPALAEELIHYHAKYRPSETATHTFEAKHN